MTKEDILKWNKISNNFAKFTASDPFKNEFIYPMILKELGTIKSKRILDLGSGSGEFAKKIAALGADVTGIDGSKKLIQIANNDSSPNIKFVQSDLNKKTRLKNSSFNFVTFVYSLMDIEKYEIAINESYRVLKNKGELLITIPHPCFTTPVFIGKRGILGRVNLKLTSIKWESYFEKRKINKNIIKNYTTTHYHRTVSDYINTIIETGFTIRKISEPKMNDKLIKKTGFFMGKYFPKVLFIKAIKS